jgi:hypothetical protein
VALCFVFCSPLGLVFLWLHPQWQKQTKIIITPVMAVLVIGIAIYDQTPAGKAEMARTAARQAAEDKRIAAQIAADEKRQAAEDAANAKKQAADEAAEKANEAAVR